MRHAFAPCLALLCAGLLAAPTPAQQTDAETGRADAAQAVEQFDQAEKYHTGQGVMQNFRTAAEWYRQAAEQGHPGAQNRLGQYYHSGRGVAQDQDQALIWLEKAADQGDPQHVFDLAKVLEGSDPARAATLYEQAAGAGSQDAAVSLGVLYQDGTGVPQDFARAHDLYLAPAAAGHARAANNLGLLYARGNGVAQDYERATALFQTAAKQGLPTAMTNLSVMYANGFGIAQSDDLAAEWERHASQARQDAMAVNAAILCLFDNRLERPENTPDARAALLQMAKGGDPVALFLAGWLVCSQPGATIPDHRQAARLFRAAADRGHAPSMFNLAQFYLHGRGVPQDFMQGYMWLTLAGAAGYPQTEGQITALHQRMTAAQVNEAQNKAAEIWKRFRPL